MDMTPAQAYVQVLVSFKTVMLPMITFGEPGAQGAGIQGAGVKTPESAVVAAIRAGLVGALHISKGGIFVAGI